MQAAVVGLMGLLAFGLASDARHGLGEGTTEPLLLIYVGAEDCGPCRTWRRDHKPRLLRDLDGKAADYREVIAPRLARAFDEEVWPPDLLPFRADAKAVAGVPLWLVIRGDRVAAVAGGLSAWEKSVAPAIRRLPPR